jgi:glycosyltransferase involved in cell wall biosynthesis
MHDMWAVTGGCTNPQGCERWRDGCGSCPQLAGDVPMEKAMEFDRDATAWLWRRKRLALQRARLNIVTPSEWMRTRLEASGCLAPPPIAMVRNVVDTRVFIPGNSRSAREYLGIEPDARVVLFVGRPGDVAGYRGRHPIMLDALGMLREGLPIEEAARLTVLMVGAGGEALAARLGATRCVCTGRVEGERAMSRCFAASDVYLNTSQYDNFPAVVQESLSCGVPPVASAVGGIPEMVVHEKTGLLAHPQDAAGFAAHLQRVLVDEDLRGRLGMNARRWAEEQFSAETVLPAILDVYGAAIAAHQVLRSQGGA